MSPLTYVLLVAFDIVVYYDRSLFLTFGLILWQFFLIILELVN